MINGTSRVSEVGAARPAAGRGTPHAAKRPVNLTLDPEAVAHAEAFGQQHGISLSKLVTGFLYALPSVDNNVVAELPPPLKRLYGLTEGTKVTRADYRDHLSKKYGGR